MATRTVPKGHLPPKLEAVLVRLCRQAPKPLNVTQAVKLPYLVDVVANHVLGHRVTDGHHQAWEHGVVAAEAWNYFKARPVDSSFELTPVTYSEETRVQVEEDAAEALLDEDERRIVDFVAEEYAYVSATELGRLTKRMNPAVRVWGSNHEADVSENAYERISWDYQEMVEAVSHVSLDRLRRESRPISSPEDAVA